MEKVVVPQKVRENVFFDYVYDVVLKNSDKCDENGGYESYYEEQSVKVEVTPYISIDFETSLILGYIAQYFYPNIDRDNSKWNDVIVQLTGRNVWYAEEYLREKILEELTNIDLSNISPNTIIDLYNLVVPKIENFYDFRNRLDETLYDVKDCLDQRKSIGGVIDGLVNRITEFIQAFGEIDPEQMKTLVADLLTQIQNSNLTPILQEANKYNQSIKSTRKTKKEKIAK